MKGNSTQSSKAASKVPVVVFGLDEHGKPKGARFGQDHAALAAKAAAALKLQVLAVTNGTLAQLAAKLRPRPTVRPRPYPKARATVLGTGMKSPRGTWWWRRTPRPRAGTKPSWLSAKAKC
jgi:hypothetical protein